MDFSHSPPVRKTLVASLPPSLSYTSFWSRGLILARLEGAKNFVRRMTQTFVPPETPSRSSHKSVSCWGSRALRGAKRSNFKTHSPMSRAHGASKKLCRIEVGRSGELQSESPKYSACPGSFVASVSLAGRSCKRIEPLAECNRWLAPIENLLRFCGRAIFNGTDEAIS